MNKIDVKLNSQRITFSKKMKRTILLEIIRGLSAQEAFEKHIYGKIENISNDRKYASKLVFKWRSELYNNREILNLLSHDVNCEMIQEQIDDINSALNDGFDLKKALDDFS